MGEIESVEQEAFAEISRLRKLERQLRARIDELLTHREQCLVSIETLEAALRDLYSEANHVISGGDDPHDRCTECGCAGYGMLRDAMSRARAVLEKGGGSE